MFKACFVATDYEDEVKKCANNSCDIDAVVSFEEFELTSEMMPSFKACCLCLAISFIFYFQYVLTFEINIHFRLILLVSLQLRVYSNQKGGVLTRKPSIN